MTLKFDMKHICKKGGTGIRGVRGFIWDWVGSLVDRDRVICMEADWAGQGGWGPLGAQSFSEEGIQI